MICVARLRPDSGPRPNWSHTICWEKCIPLNFHSAAARQARWAGEVFRWNGCLAKIQSVCVGPPILLEICMAIQLDDAIDAPPAPVASRQPPRSRTRCAGAGWSARAHVLRARAPRAASGNQWSTTNRHLNKSQLIATVL